MCNTVIPQPGISDDYILSGRRESNSALALPKRIYYRYTTARAFGLPRIELGSHTPEACILPLYYSPVRVGRIELPPADWQPTVLPLNHTRLPRQSLARPRVAF